MSKGDAMKPIRKKILFGTIIIVGILLTVGLITEGKKMSRNQIIMAEQNIKVLQQFVPILEKEKDALLKLGTFYLKFGDESLIEALRMIYLGFEVKQQELEELTDFFEKYEQLSFFWRLKQKIPYIDYDKHFKFIESNFEHLHDAIQGIAFIMVNKVDEDEKLLNDPKIRRIFLDLNEAIDITKEIKEDITKLKKALYGETEEKEKTTKDILI